MSIRLLLTLLLFFQLAKGKLLVNKGANITQL